MNRIEAINAMLDGKVIVDGVKLLKIAGKRVYFLDDELEEDGKDWFLATDGSWLILNDGYSIYQEPKPEDTIRLIINGKTYKAVEE